MKKKYKFIDIYRLIAVLLVMYGHLVGTGLYAYDIPEFIKGTMASPILTGGGIEKADALSGFLYYKLHTQPATFGVNMFFMCTGFLVPGMLLRYNRKQFCINRFFRLVPVLAVCEALILAIVYISQGITYTPKQYIGTIFILTIQLFSIPATSGVIWTLIIEVVFYICCMILKKIDRWSIALLLSVDAIVNMLTLEYELRHFENTAYDFRFVGIILIGCIASLTKEEKDRVRAWAEVMGVALVNILIFDFAKNRLGVTTTYTNIATILIPAVFFMILLEIERVGGFEKFTMVQPFKVITESSYPFYLMHVCVGLTTMYWLSRKGINPWANLLISITLCCIVAWLIETFIEKPVVKFSKKLIAKAGNQ